MLKNATDIIRKKRDGGTMTPEEIRDIIRRYTDDQVPDYQMAALLMAVFFQGLDPQELSAWTDAMLRSGQVLNLGNIEGHKIDKHSTGGVGDKISLPLAPAVACLGVRVPMISGRGLGHTGGTLDKLESIPGFQIDLSAEEAVGLLEKHGLFLIGQTGQLAPADRKLYALRDVTGTVESIPLIASSIMSKKIAEGIDGLVLDVKVGKGAFMKDLEQAKKLARTMIGIGARAGKTVRAVLTDMNIPIGRAVGNALEVAESIEILRGGGPPDAVELTVELGAEMLVMGGKAPELESGKEAVRGVLRDGRALERFAAIIEAQGGDPRVCDDPERLPTAKRKKELRADKDGIVCAVSPRTVAAAALSVGAGRRVKEDDIDPATGVTIFARPGDEVCAGDVLAVLHHNESGQGEAMALLKKSFEIGDEPSEHRPLIIERL